MLEVNDTALRSRTQEQGKRECATEDDVSSFLKVDEVMEKDLILVRYDDNLSRVFDFFSTYDFLVYPVVDRNNKLIGIIEIENLRTVLKEQHCWDLILAKDVVSHLKENVFTSMTLKCAMDKMAESGMQQIPVVERDRLKPVGILDARKAKKTVKEKLILQGLTSVN